MIDDGRMILSMAALQIAFGEVKWGIASGDVPWIIGASPLLHILLLLECCKTFM